MTIARHAVELLGVALVVLGPAPLCLQVGARYVGVADRLLAALLAWCALQAGIALGLGLLGWLTVGPLLAVQVVLLAIGLAGGRQAIALPRPAPPLAPAEWLVGTVVALLGVTLLLTATAHPITEHDSLGYHLPALARWVHAGAFLPLERDDQVGRYPYGWELLSTLVVLPLREDVFVCLPNLAAWSMLGLAVYSLARALGAPRLHAMAGAALVLAMPVVRDLVPTLRVDLALAACVLAGLRFALARDGVLLLMALGVAATAKATGPIYGVLVLAAAALASPPEQWVRGPRPRVVALPIVAALAVGTFWYARNLVEIGNPFGPVRLAVGDWTLLPGTLEPAAIRLSTLAALFAPTSVAHWEILGGAARKALRLPALLLVTGALGLLWPPVRVCRATLMIAALFVIFVLTYAMTPFSGDNGINGWRLTPWMREQVRFAIPALGLLGVLGAMGAARLGPWVVAAAVVAGTARAIEPMTLVAAALVALAAAWAWSRRPLISVLTAAALGLAILGGSHHLRGVRTGERIRRDGPVVQHLSDELGPDDAVAHIATAFSYGLYGPRFTNRVTFLPDTSLDRDRWIDALRVRGVTLVAVGPLMPGRRKRHELAWLRDPAGPFVRVAGEDPARETVLYRLRPANDGR